MRLLNKLKHLRLVLTDSRWLPFYLQRQFMAIKVRGIVCELLARYFRPDCDYYHLSDFNNSFNVQFKKSGIVQLGQLLTTEQSSELYDYFSTKFVSDPYISKDKTFPPHSKMRHPNSHIAHHNAIDIIKAPYLLSIANRSDILSMVESILGCKPTLSYLAVWWSYHTEIGAQQAEYFHRDVDDWRFIKLFIYLTDVTKTNGPHVYVSCSANSQLLRKIRRFPDDEVISTFGEDAVMELTGLAGEGFLEDTFGIHKGKPVADGHRLIFQAVYSMFPLPYGPIEPVFRREDLPKVEGVVLDKWINRLYIKAT